MKKISEIYEYLCQIAPLDLQMDFDNSGFQIGRKSNEVEKVLLSLDVTDSVVEEAVAIGAKLIISHHPLIFKGIKSIDEVTPEGNRILRLMENSISVISMHTNLDIAEGGVNDVLIRLLGAEPVCGLDGEGCGRVGEMKQAMPLNEFLSTCRDKLNANGLRYYDAGKKVHKLAVMGGSGGEALEDAYNYDCDTYVTADIKYHQFLMAQELGMNLIDADHFCTENPVMAVLQDKLTEQFKDVDFIISEAHGPIIRFA